MRQILLIQELQSKFPQIEDITDHIPKHGVKKWSTRNANEIDSIVVHHAASEAPLANQASYHVNGHGWPGIGYHIVIHQGKIFQVNDLLAESAHCKGHNDHSIGICILGDLSKRTITPLESELLSASILTVKSLFNIKEVVGHNQWVKTACPCTSMDKIREDVMTLEEQLIEAETPMKKEEIAYRIANAILYRYNMFQKGVDSYGKPVEEGKRKWALEQVLKLEVEMRKNGMLT